MPPKSSPRENAFIAVVIALLVAGLLGTGYWLGHRGMDDYYNPLVHMDMRLDEIEKYLTQGQEDQIGIAVFCHNDSSDWATIEMANVIGKQYDIQVFVHGNCLTHEVVDIRERVHMYDIPTTIPPDIICLPNEACKVMKFPQPEGQ